MPKENEAFIGFRVPLTLRCVIDEFISLDTHLNISEFVRDAVREKIHREAPQLLEKLFRNKSKATPAKATIN